jgi:hypothetical protein
VSRRPQEPPEAQLVRLLTVRSVNPRLAARVPSVAPVTYRLGSWLEKPQPSGTPG